MWPLPYEPASWHDIPLLVTGVAIVILVKFVIAPWYWNNKERFQDWPWDLWR